MKNKNYIICFGNGLNQRKIIRYLEKYNLDTIILDRKKKINLKENFKFIKTSIYDFDFSKVKKLLKYFKIHDLIYRSSGPSILLYNKLSEYYKLNKISYDLANCIYSKTFLSNYLKNKKVKNIKSSLIKSFSEFKKLKGFNVFKPDAPIVGKTNIFLLKSNMSDNLRFQNIKLSSHNKRISVSKFINGKDITAIYFKNKTNNKINLISIVQEFNIFKNSELTHLGICSPQLFKLNNFLKHYIEEVPLKLNKLFYQYNGFFSISYKLNGKNLLIYEINVGLSGDKFAEIIFPKTYSGGDIFKIEVKNLISKVKNNDFKPNKNFVGIINKKNFLKKKLFILKLNLSVNKCISHLND